MPFVRLRPATGDEAGVPALAGARADASKKAGNTKSRRDFLRIAQRFIVGNQGETSASPEGTAETPGNPQKLDASALWWWRNNLVIGGHTLKLSDYGGFHR